MSTNKVHNSTDIPIIRESRDECIHINSDSDDDTVIGIVDVKTPYNVDAVNYVKDMITDDIKSRRSGGLAVGRASGSNAKIVGPIKSQVSVLSQIHALQREESIEQTRVKDGILDSLDRNRKISQSSFMQRASTTGPRKSFGTGRGSFSTARPSSAAIRRDSGAIKSNTRSSAFSSSYSRRDSTLGYNRSTCPGGTRRLSVGVTTAEDIKNFHKSLQQSTSTILSNEASIGTISKASTYRSSRHNSIRRNSSFNEMAVFINPNVHRQGMNQIMSAMGSKLQYKTTESFERIEPENSPHEKEEKVKTETSKRCFCF